MQKSALILRLQHLRGEMSAICFQMFQKSPMQVSPYLHASTQ